MTAARMNLAEKQNVTKAMLVEIAWKQLTRIVGIEELA